MKKKRLLLIGWDGADWKVINPLLDQGLMPNLEKLVNGGVIGKLATLDPPYSPMLWTSIATGKRPYKHGVLGFTEVSPDGKRVRPVMSTSRKVQAVWDMLSEHELKTHVVGWWPSHPAEKMNGIAISNLYQKHKGRITEPWPLAPKTVYPEDQADRFANFRVHPEELTYEHILPFVPDAARIDQRKDKRLLTVSKITAQASSLHAAFTHILRTEEWNFAALYLDAIDHYCHGFMRYHPPKRPHISQADFDLYKDVVVGGYRFHDMMLGRLMQLAGEDATIMLVSDHGFQPDHLRPVNIPKEPAGPAYEHSPFGIICMKGPGIEKDELIHGASLLDITPTILSLFDLPVAKDMDGKVLRNVYENVPDVRRVDSWETDISFEVQSEDVDNAEAMESVMLQQLEDLGYIENQKDDLENRIQQTHNECQFNLAKSYLNGGRIKNCIEILEKLHAENPDVIRYAMRLAACYQMIGEFKRCRSVVDHIRGLESFNKPVLDILEANLLMGERQPIKALKLLRKTESKVAAHQSRIHYQLASCFALLQRWDDAEKSLQKDLVIDPDHTPAHHLLGQVYMKTHRYEEAINSFLTAIGQDFYNPPSHVLLGRNLYHIGKYTEASKAFETAVEMMPGNNEIRQLLIKLYENELREPEKAGKHRGQLIQKTRGAIYVVSGLPRSGTSMMMQMLEAGGMTILTDEKRKADESNPKGYYELDAVKRLNKNNKWLHRANGKCIKVIANLLPFLSPNFNYKVIFMKRPLEEVLASQDEMLERSGKSIALKKPDQNKLRASYVQTLKGIKEWSTSVDFIDILYVDHHEVLDDPHQQSLMINEFLDYKLLPELMAAEVDPELYRVKTIKT